MGRWKLPEPANGSSPPLVAFFLCILTSFSSSLYLYFRYPIDTMTSPREYHAGFDLLNFQVAKINRFPCLL